MAYFGGGGHSKSAYEVAVERGFVGSRDEWLMTLLQGTRETVESDIAPISAEPGDIWITED